MRSLIIGLIVFVLVVVVAFLVGTSGQKDWHKLHGETARQAGVEPKALVLPEALTDARIIYRLRRGQKDDRPQGVYYVPDHGRVELRWMADDQPGWARLFRTGDVAVVAPDTDKATLVDASDQYVEFRLLSSDPKPHVATVRLGPVELRVLLGERPDQ